MKRSLAALAGAVLAMSCAIAAAQAYPAKPLRLVIPIVPGGSVDLIARRFAQKMSEQMGQPIVVENIPGASGQIGTAQVVRAAPDGYTFMWATVGETIVYYFMSKNRPYDALKDLAPIMAAVSGISVIVAHPSVPVNSLKELIDYARANPGKLAYASAGIGSYFHMTAELFKSVAGVDMLHVPYKGVPPALQGVAAGDAQVMFVSILSSAPFRNAGKMKALAVVEEKRWGGMASLPAITETLPAFEKLPTFYAFYAPAGIPRQVQLRLNEEGNKALKAPDMQDYLEKQAFVSIGGTPEEMHAMHKRGVEIYGAVAKLAGLKAE